MLNARSICNKIDYLRAYVDHHKPDILAITESWGRAPLTDSLVTPVGYCIFRQDRFDRQGGGVIILIRELLSPLNFLFPESIKFEDSIWCVISISSGRSILIGCIYRSPSSEATNDVSMLRMLSLAANSGHNYCLILGDFNFPTIDWDLLQSSPREQAFLDCTLENCLTQMVYFPTRGDSILDLIFVNDPSLVSTVEVQSEFPGSDHKTVIASLRVKPNSVSSDKATADNPHFRFSLADWSCYRELIKRVTIEEIAGAHSVDAAWDTLKNNIISAANAAIPKVRHIRRCLGVPITGVVRTAFRYRKRVFHNLKNSRSHLADTLRTEADAKLRDALLDSRRKFETSIATSCKSNPKRFWAHARAAFACKPRVNNVYDSDGKMSENNKEAARVFNKFFASVFTESEDQLPDLPAPPPPTNILCDIKFSLTSIFEVIKSLPSYSSPGPDGIQNILLKEGGPDLILLIHELFTRIILSGTIPSEWKNAIIFPIFKKGSRNDPQNYRPISLTCTLCKVFERLLKDLMLRFLSENKLLNDSQHGFLPRRSCCTALLRFLEYVTYSVDNNLSVDVVYLDFSKAFDSVPHNRLLWKLEEMGFGDRVIALISSFLTNRQQKVCIGQSDSAYISVTSGVPQGSVIGPLLFVIYINDIDTGLSSNIIKFADDVKLFCSFQCERVCQAHIVAPNPIQHDLDIISDWCSRWLLSLNAEKCSCLHIGHSNPSRDFKIGDSIVATSTVISDLGIYFTKDLKPSVQCLRAAAKAQRIIATIKLSFKFLDVSTLSVLYKALVRPILEYCCVVWCPYYVKDIDHLEKVQRRFTRILPDLRHLPYEERLSHFKIQTLHTRRLQFDLTTVFKIIHGFIDIDPSLLFTFCHESRTRGHKLKLATNYSRLDARKYFFSSRVVPHWNALPASCAEAPDVNTFKHELSKHLISSGAH